MPSPSEITATTQPLKNQDHPVDKLNQGLSGLRALLTAISGCYSYEENDFTINYQYIGDNIQLAITLTDDAMAEVDRWQNMKS